MKKLNKGYVFLKTKETSNERDRRNKERIRRKEVCPLASLK